MHWTSPTNCHPTLSALAPFFLGPSTPNFMVHNLQDEDDDDDIPRSESFLSPIAPVVYCPPTTSESSSGLLLQCHCLIRTEIGGMSDQTGNDNRDANKYIHSTRESDNRSANGFFPGKMKKLRRHGVPGHRPGAPCG